MWTIFVEGQEYIPTFGIRVKESLEEKDFNPDNIAKFLIPETPPFLLENIFAVGMVTPYTLGLMVVLLF